MWNVKAIRYHTFARSENKLQHFLFLKLFPCYCHYKFKLYCTSWECIYSHHNHHNSSWQGRFWLKTTFFSLFSRPLYGCVDCEENYQEKQTVEQTQNWSAAVVRILRSSYNEYKWSNMMIMIIMMILHHPELPMETYMMSH